MPPCPPSSSAAGTRRSSAAASLRRCCVFAWPARPTAAASGGPCACRRALATSATTAAAAPSSSCSKTPRDDDLAAQPRRQPSGLEPAAAVRMAPIRPHAAPSTSIDRAGGKPTNTSSGDATGHNAMREPAAAPEAVIAGLTAMHRNGTSAAQSATAATAEAATANGVHRTPCPSSTGGPPPSGGSMPYNRLTGLEDGPEGRDRPPSGALHYAAAQDGGGGRVREAPQAGGGRWRQGGRPVDDRPPSTAARAPAMRQPGESPEPTLVMPSSGAQAQGFYRRRQPDAPAAAAAAASISTLVGLGEDRAQHKSPSPQQGHNRATEAGAPGPPAAGGAWVAAPSPLLEGGMPSQRGGAAASAAAADTWGWLHPGQPGHPTCPSPPTAAAAAAAVWAPPPAGPARALLPPPPPRPQQRQQHHGSTHLPRQPLQPAQRRRPLMLEDAVEEVHESVVGLARNQLEERWRTTRFSSDLRAAGGLVEEEEEEARGSRRQEQQRQRQPAPRGPAGRSSASPSGAAAGFRLKQRRGERTGPAGPPSVARAGGPATLRPVLQVRGGGAACWRGGAARRRRPA